MLRANMSIDYRRFTTADGKKSSHLEQYLPKTFLEEEDRDQYCHPSTSYSYSVLVLQPNQLLLDKYLMPRQVQNNAALGMAKGDAI
jgi:hypothetical protein